MSKKCLYRSPFAGPQSRRVGKAHGYWLAALCMAESVCLRASPVGGVFGFMFGSERA